MRRIQKEAYRVGEYGFCGNEDVGQLSAWYVLSAIGIGQPCPSVPEYHLNTPLFKNITVKLDKRYHSCDISESFEIKCDKDPTEYQYINEIRLNGKILERTYLTFDEITSGGVLELKLCKNVYDSLKRKAD